MTAGISSTNVRLTDTLLLDRNWSLISLYRAFLSTRLPLTLSVIWNSFVESGVNVIVLSIGSISTSLMMLSIFSSSPTNI